jgi:PDZ domain-containing protein
MARSQEVAAAVALRELGYRVPARPSGALVAGVAAGSPAAGKLEPANVIVSIDGRPVRTTLDAQRLIRTRRPGQPVRIGIRTNEGLREVTLTTAADPTDRSRAIIGVFLEQAARIRLPVPVKIDAGNVGGPSAGLAFALEVLEKLGRDVDRGYRLAATGELGLDGSVGPVGGLKQKTIGARDADVDIFLVPAGENAQVARSHAGDLKVIPVQSFRQALRALSTLRRRA